MLECCSFGGKEWDGLVHLTGVSDLHTRRLEPVSSLFSVKGEEEI